jgi:hypothetical protein
VNIWIWLDLEWPSGANARMLEVAHPHSEAFDEATFLVNTYTSSGSDALVWKLVGDRHSGNGLNLSRGLVDIDDYDAIGGNVDQPGSAVDLHGFFAQPNNAVYANRRVFFSQTTDVNDNGSSSGLLTHRIDVDSLTEEWADLHASGAGRYYFYPGLALRGSSPNANLALFYSYTSVPESTFASTGFKLFDDQPNSDSGPNQLYQSGQAAYVKLDSVGRNRWGDYGGAAYDWQCGHLWGAAEYAGTGNQWRTRLKAINGNGEGDCPMISIVTPNGGESLYAGDTVVIDWERSAVPAGTNLFVIYNDGNSNTTVAGPLSTAASSWQWDVPNDPTTQGRVFVGAWNGSSYELSDWSDQQFTVLGRADFTTQIAAPPVAYTGHPVPVSNGIANIGQASANRNVGIALSVNAICSTADTLLLQRIGGPLAPGQVSNAVSNPTIPGGLAPGSYTLCAIADWPNNVVEYDETNNTSGTPITIVASELFADGFESGDSSAWSATQP